MLVPTNVVSMESIAGFSNPSKKRKLISICNNNDNTTKLEAPSLYTYDNNNNNKIHQQQPKPRTEDVLINLKVTLLQLYNPHAQSLSVVRNRLCNKCNGHGIIIDDNNQCDMCYGRGVFPDEKQFTFSIQGRSHGDEIRFKGEADEKLGYVTGDLIIMLSQIPHQTFQRDGQHLYIKKEIVLVEALCGGEFYIKHLNGKIIKFNTRPGEVLAPYQIKCIPNQGMPLPSNIHRRGHIYIQFEIQFPQTQFCNPHLINVLQNFLPKAPIDPLSNVSKQNPSKTIQCELVDLAFPTQNKINDYHYSADTLISSNNNNNNNNNHTNNNHNHNNDDSDIDVTKCQL